MSVSQVKRMPALVHVGKAGDKSVDKREFLCTKRWMNCGYLWVFSTYYLNVQVRSVTTSSIVVH